MADMDTDAEIRRLQGEILELNKSRDHYKENAATFGDQAIKATERNYELWEKLVDSERQLADCMEENKTNREKNPDTRPPLTRLARLAPPMVVGEQAPPMVVGGRPRAGARHATLAGARRRPPIGRGRRTPIGRRRS